VQSGENRIVTVPAGGPSNSISQKLTHCSRQAISPAPVGHVLDPTRCNHLYLAPEIARGSLAPSAEQFHEKS